MAVNPNNLLGQSNPNGTVGVSLGIDPAGANEAFSAGATSGFYVTPTSPAGMSVQVGGAVGVIDSALVRSASGITFPVGNVTGTPITLTVPAAPSTNSRIDSVVLYVDTSVTATATDGANAVGMEIVSGTSASSPVPPTEQQIRSAIQDGASIAYTVLANITVSSSTSTITASNISQANRAQLAADKIDFATIVQSGEYTNNSVALESFWTTFKRTGNITINFDNPFQNIPIVMLTVADKDIAGSGGSCNAFSARLMTTTANGFTCQLLFPSGVTSPTRVAFRWLAVSL